MPPYYGKQTDGSNEVLASKTFLNTLTVVAFAGMTVRNFKGYPRLTEVECSGRTLPMEVNYLSLTLFRKEDDTVLGNLVSSKGTCTTFAQFSSCDLDLGDNRKSTLRTLVTDLSKAEKRLMGYNVTSVFKTGHPAIYSWSVSVQRVSIGEWIVEEECCEVNMCLPYIRLSPFVRVLFHVFVIFLPICGNIWRYFMTSVLCFFHFSYILTYHTWHWDGIMFSTMMYYTGTPHLSWSMCCVSRFIAVVYWRLWFTSLSFILLNGTAEYRICLIANKNVMLASEIVHL